MGLFLGRSGESQIPSNWNRVANHGSPNHPAILERRRNSNHVENNETPCGARASRPPTLLLAKLAARFCDCSSARISSPGKHGWRWSVSEWGSKWPESEICRHQRDPNALLRNGFRRTHGAGARRRLVRTFQRQCLVQKYCRPGKTEIGRAHV